METILGQIQYWYWRVRLIIWNLKNGVISWIYWIFKFCLKKFRAWLCEMFKVQTLVILKDYNYSWFFYINRMVKQLFWRPNKWILKICNLGRGWCLGLYDHLFRKWFKEIRDYSSKDFSYGHVSQINIMSKWLFWRACSGNLKN